MGSLINVCLIVFVASGCFSVHGEAFLKRYASLISDVHKYYATSSVFFVLSRTDRRWQEYTLLSMLCREFSRTGVPTLMMSFDNLGARTNFYRPRITRPLVVIVLKTVEDIAEFRESIRQMGKAYPIWLVLFGDDHGRAICEFCSRPAGNILSLRFDTEMLVVCCHDPTLKEWWSIHPNRTKTSDFAVWSKNEGLKLLVMEGLYARRGDVDGAELRVAFVTKSTLVRDYGHRVGGFGGSILRELKNAMNFTIGETLREIGFGSWSSTNKKWSGAVGHLAEGKADLGVAEFTITNARRTAVDFTLPLIISRNRLYIRVPDGSGVRWGSYVEVFKFEIWMALIVLLITTPILLTVIKVKKGASHLSSVVIENYLQVWGIFCQEAVSQFPVETPLRIAYISIFVSAVVVSASYSASLISFLTVSSINLPFSTMDGFADDKSYQLIVFQNSSNYDLFASATDPLLARMMTLMKPWNDLPQTLEEGFEQVCREKVAFFTDDVVQKTMNQQIKCKVVEIESGRVDYLAMILSPDSQYTGLVNYHIQRFQANGLLGRLKKKYFHKGDVPEITYPVVGIWSVIPLLSVLAGGITLALVVLLCEKMYNCKQTNEHKWRNEIDVSLTRGTLTVYPNTSLR